MYCFFKQKGAEFIVIASKEKIFLRIMFLLFPAIKSFFFNFIIFCHINLYNINAKSYLYVFFSCLQFVVAPYSLFVSGTLALALIPPIYASHYISFLSLR